MDKFVNKPKYTKFVDDHVTDTLYKEIVNELTNRKSDKSGGLKLKLTSEMLRQFLFYVSIGLSFKDSADFSGLGEGTRADYVLRSKKFAEVSNLAKRNIVIKSQLAIYRAIEGVEAGYVKIVNPKNNEEKYIEVKYERPDVNSAWRWMEQVEKLGGGDDGDGKAPLLGAPQNEREVELQEMLLNRHHDYVQRKRRGKDTQAVTDRDN